MEIRNFIRLIFLLLVFPFPRPTEAGYQISYRDQRRVKRISTPHFEKERTLELAKYVVSIRSRTPRKYFGDNHFCGGAIISLSFILTAAHCTMDKRKIMHRSRVLLVVAGTVNRLKYITGETINAPVKQVFVPENFTIFNTNNIALIQLTENLPTDNFRIAVINLPTSEPIPGLNYTVLGWGRVYKGGPLASSIVHIDVLMITHAECDNMLNTFMPEMICAGNLDNGLDENPCAGDTGDPMILNGTIYGIVSYRIGCGSTSLPSVYTNVYYHLNWINEMMTNGKGVLFHIICHSLVTQGLIFLYLFVI
ncbi:chymotrypsin-2 [Drosophila tropicalis]|uniref:chymotrypsin-2 n=1 Tax=Drosophila tropicalis TaxID=46794 RepID=UPI0035ABA18B